MMVCVVTDSAAALPAPLAAEAGITVVPLLLHLDGRELRDGELTLSELLPRLDGPVKTSGPSPAQLVEAIDALAPGADVLVLTLARSMSSTYDAAHLAAREIAGGREIRILDSRTAAGAQGLVALHAAAVARRGAGLDEVEAAAREAIARVRLVATVDNLDRLAASGRVPNIAGLAGRVLNVNPIFEFRAGGVHAHRPAFTRDAALDRIYRLFDRSSLLGASLHVAALHALDDDAAESLLARVRGEHEPETSFVAAFSLVMVAHTGPGLVGLSWWWQEPAPG